MTPEDGTHARVLARACLPTRSRVAGALAGKATPGAAHGADFDGASPWQDGDDLRLVEWNATARTGSLQVRRGQAPARSVVTLFVDASPGMWLGTNSSKYSSACQVADAVAFLARRDGHVLEHLDPATLHPLPGWTPSAGPVSSPERPLPAVRDLLVVVSDFRPRAKAGILAHSGSRVLAVEIRDPSEMVPPQAGVVRLLCPSGGASVLADTSNERWRAEFSDRATADRRELSASLETAGAEHIVVRNEGLALLDFALALELLP